MRWSAVGDAGVVDEDIQSTPSAKHVFHQSGDLFGLRKIAVHGPYFDAVAACLARHCIDFAVIDIDQIKIDAFASECQRDRASNSGRGPGHQRLLSAQHFHRVTTLPAAGARTSSRSLLNAPYSASVPKAFSFAPPAPSTWRSGPRGRHWSRENRCAPHAGAAGANS